MIHIFLGTKAQLIKMAPIMRELQLRNIKYNFIFSGQHQDTIGELRENFGIKSPDFVLHKGKDITSILKMGYWLIKIIIISLFNSKKMWREDKAGVVLNHGDTFSTLAGSILAKIGGHKNAHVESGLRSFDLLNPFPEELTRLCVFNLTDIFFCPNEWAVRNVGKYNGVKIETNGNTLYDSLAVIKNLPLKLEIDTPKADYCVVSFHRFENIFKQSQLVKIVEILEVIASDILVLVIMHKPTLRKLQMSGLEDRLKSNKNIQLRPRYDYHSFIHLVSHAKFIVTDGGSNQEECFYLGKPCLLLRHATERQEGLGHNVVISNFEIPSVLGFVKTYHLYEKGEVNINPSPSILIASYLEKNHT